MTASTSKSQKNERRGQIRRITDRLTDELYNTGTTPDCFSGVERTADAILLLDSEKRVLHVSSQAEEIINRSSIHFTLFPRFALPSLPNTARFQAFVNQKDKKTRPLILQLANEETREVLLFSCFRLSEPKTADLNVARFLIKLRDPYRQLNNQLELFIEQCNLTRAEGRLCSALADGLTLNDYCAYWNIRISTTRSQLSSIFYKTQTKGQLDLLRLIFLFPFL